MKMDTVSGLAYNTASDLAQSTSFQRLHWKYW
jgi:hypothetical protein